MISKELLSKVLGYEVKEVLGMLENSANKTILSYIFEDASLNEGKRIINIYELAHKCKEWAKAYTLVSAYYFENGEEGAWCCLHKNLCSTDGETFHADNEPEAIFKACQWILDNKEIK